MALVLRNVLRNFLLVKSDPQFTICRNLQRKVQKSQRLPGVYIRGKVNKPAAGSGCFRRIVHFPEEYTVKPLDVTNLGGRDPDTGRVVSGRIGGGIKHKYHWVDFKRIGPKDGPPLVEQVFDVIKDGCRTALVALVGGGDRLRYILATENMKPGDLIRTSGHIPRNAVRANEGDAYPVGALPVGTQVNCVEVLPGIGGLFAHGAGTYATIVRRVGDRVIVQIPSKREISIHQECMAVVGRLSNVLHNKTPIGSAGKNRELGNRPKSGLWQRKKGCHGRKIRKPPPIREYLHEPPEKPEVITFTMPFKIYS